MKRIDKKISCNVCQDLLPLVLDQVASEDSVKLVKEHIAECESCRMSYGEASELEAPNPRPNDQQILKKIKTTIYRSMFLFVLIGGLVGIALTNSQNMFYNSLIMPLVGALSYLVYRKHWYVPCLALTAVSYVWIFITAWIQEGYMSALFIMPIPYNIIYGILLIIGVIIAALLSYAFRKEEMV